MSIYGNKCAFIFSAAPYIHLVIISHNFTIDHYIVPFLTFFVVVPFLTFFVVVPFLTFFVVVPFFTFYEYYHPTTNPTKATPYKQMYNH